LHVVVAHTSLCQSTRRTYVINTRRTKRVVALAVGLSLVAAACGGDDDEPTSRATSRPRSPAESPPTGEEPADEPAEEGDEPTEEPGDEPTEEPAEEPGAGGGTLVWAHEQEPPDMHLDDPNNNLSITSWVRSALLEGLYGISAANEFYPELSPRTTRPSTTATARSR
jgi:peptide/nickel transport system substrate-binding protein